MKGTEITKKIVSSYDPSDVTFLLKDLSEFELESSSENREFQIQIGAKHYSESLPIEEIPTEIYMDVFWKTLTKQKEKIAFLTGVIAEQIYTIKGENLVLVSLARAGTPVGILVKRYLEEKYNTRIPHYSISIIRGKGIDENAIQYILQHHPGADIQFIDGWTGKGAISLELKQSCREMKIHHGVQLDDNIAVLADPGYCSSIYGTREDVLVPSACLNSTVTGLISRTVLNKQLIGREDFHGAKYYAEFAAADVSTSFIEIIANEFSQHYLNAERIAKEMSETPPIVNFKGLNTIKKISADFQLDDMHFIKPGIGETTRVLLRRVPWKILVKDLDHPAIEHIKVLAARKEVELVSYPEMDYVCCGLIKKVR